MVTDNPGASYETAASVGVWAKRYYYANRVAVETILRAHDIGSTQWLVLRRLAMDGPTPQRDLSAILQLERASISGIVSTLVRKGVVEQVTSPSDRRQRQLDLTPAGRELWGRLPDPFAQVREVALEGIDRADIDIAIEVLNRASAQVQGHDFTQR